MFARLPFALLLVIAGCACHGAAASSTPDALALAAPDATAPGVDAELAISPDASPPGIDAGFDSSDSGPDASAPDACAPDASLPPDAALAPDASASDAGPLCVTNKYVDALTLCMNEGTGPDICLHSIVAETLCDIDGDGIGDDFEAALVQSYAPVLLMNAGGYGGNPEDAWFANVKHFVSHAQLFYRPDGVSASLVDPAPTLAALPGETYFYQGSSRLAADPSAGQASDFWLCLTDDTDPNIVVSTSAIMLSLPDGIDVESVVHPANGALAASDHYFVSYTPFWAYNSHSTVDDHEGDRETVAVFVDRMTGAVDAADFERHNCSDNVHFIDVATYGAKDPTQDVPAGNVTAPPPGVRGLRFWDYAGFRHRLVIYISTGGHAPYDFPGNTYIISDKGPRDTHDGDGARLFVAAGRFQASPSAVQVPITINFHNPGEPQNITLDWAHYRGQWGCQVSDIANSWPGPFGNERHPRPVYDRTWGSPPSGP